MLEMEENTLIEYHQGLLEPEAEAAVKRWLDAGQVNQSAYYQCVQIWEHARIAGELVEIDEAADLEEVHARLGIEESSQRPFPIWRIAASILLLVGLGLGGWYFLGPKFAPEMLTLRTQDAPGELLTLKDGSKVRLNANSSLRYPAEFTGDRRELQLEGQAWFAVAPDKAHPFVVRHGSSETEVLGTEFDIRAYPKEGAIRVTVFEGEVRLRAATDTNRAILLQAGHTGAFSNSMNAPVLADHDLNQGAWRTQSLVFEQTPLFEVISVLERHYQVKINWEDEGTSSDCLLSARFDEDALESVLETISLVFNGSYSMDDNRNLVILRVNC